MPSVVPVRIQQRCVHRQAAFTLVACQQPHPTGAEGATTTARAGKTDSGSGYAAVLFM